MLINNLMDKIYKEAEIASRLLAKDGLTVDKNDILSEISTLAVLAMHSYESVQIENTASFNTFFNRCVDRWMIRHRAKLIREKKMFQPLSDFYDEGEEFDPGIRLIINEIDSRLSADDSAVFHHMLYEDQPDSKRIGEKCKLSFGKVAHAKLNIRKAAHEIMEVR